MESLQDLATRFVHALRVGFTLETAAPYHAAAERLARKLKMSVEDVDTAALRYAAAPQLDTEFNMAKAKATKEKAAKRVSAPKKGLFGRKTSVEGAPSPARKGRAGRVAHAAIITILVDKNPKRPGSAADAQFQLYRNGQSVGDFFAAGGTRAALNYDLSHGYISVK